jgi:hypothetical protein
MNRQEVMSDNVAVLGNAVEFAAAIIKKVSGNAISNTVDGNLVDDSYLKTAIASKMNSKLVPYMGA